MFFAIEAHLKGNFVKNQIQGFLHLSHEFCAIDMILVIVYHLAQLSFHFGKGFPPDLCSLSEALTKLRHRNTLLTPVDQFLNVLSGVELRIITWMQFQSFFKISQSTTFLFQIKIGIPHAEVP